jgi:hypothetical protein
MKSEQPVDENFEIDLEDVLIQFVDQVVGP